MLALPCMLLCTTPQVCTVLTSKYCTTWSSRPGLSWFHQLLRLGPVSSDRAVSSVVHVCDAAHFASRPSSISLLQRHLPPLCCPVLCCSLPYRTCVCLCVPCVTFSTKFFQTPFLFRTPTPTHQTPTCATTRQICPPTTKGSRIPHAAGSARFTSITYGTVATATGRSGRLKTTGSFKLATC